MPLWYRATNAMVHMKGSLVYSGGGIYPPELTNYSTYMSIKTLANECFGVPNTLHWFFTVKEYPVLVFL